MMTNSRKIEVLKLVKSEYKALIRKGYKAGLCFASLGLVRRGKINPTERKHVTNLINMEIFLKGFYYSEKGEKTPCFEKQIFSGYAWPIEDTQSRIDFLDSEIKKLKNKPTWKRLVEYLRKEK